MEQGDLNDRIENTFRDGIMNKVSPIIVYDHVLREIVDREVFDRSLRGSGEPPCPVLEAWPPAHSDIGWFDRLGPNYSSEKAQEYLENRYDGLMRRTRHTRDRLMMKPEFVESVRQLRAEGYLDWHILGAINTAAMTWRTYLAQPSNRSEWERSNQIWMNQADEDPDAPAVPAEEFSVDQLKSMMQGNNMSSLRVWGHNVRTPTPDMEAVDQFLSARYRHYDDDIQHEDPFTS